MSNSSFDKVKDTIDLLIQEKVCAGCSIAIGRDGDEAYSYFAGMADAENGISIDADTIFQMHSLTKPVTAIAFMQLLEKGKFKLTDRLSDFIPEYSDVKVRCTAEDGTISLRPANSSITIEHLLTMTAGITYGGTDCIDQAFRRLSDGIIESRNTETPWDTQRYVRELASVPLLFEPGKGFVYGLCFDVLGALIEISSGKSLEEYCRDNIFNPLGMSDACFILPECKKKHLAKSYTHNEDCKLVRRDTTGTLSIDSYSKNNKTYQSGGGGLLCTVRDYFSFARMLANGGCLNGEQIISEQSLKMITTPKLNNTQRIMYPREGDTCLFAENYSYGYGVHILTEPKGVVPEGEWGWAGTMGTWLSVDPVNHMFWVYAHQIVPYNYERHIPRLTEAIYSSI